LYLEKSLVDNAEDDLRFKIAIEKDDGLYIIEFPEIDKLHKIFYAKLCIVLAQYNRYGPGEHFYVGESLRDNIPGTLASMLDNEEKRVLYENMQPLKPLPQALKNLENNLSNLLSKSKFLKVDLDINGYVESDFTELFS
jgi:hypothetical protein